MASIFHDLPKVRLSKAFSMTSLNGKIHSARQSVNRKASLRSFRDNIFPLREEPEDLRPCQEVYLLRAIDPKLYSADDTAIGQHQDTIFKEHEENVLHHRLSESDSSPPMTPQASRIYHMDVRKHEAAFVRFLKKDTAISFQSLKRTGKQKVKPAMAETSVIIGESDEAGLLRSLNQTRDFQGVPLLILDPTLCALTHHAALTEDLEDYANPQSRGPIFTTSILEVPGPANEPVTSDTSSSIYSIQDDIDRASIDTVNLLTSTSHVHLQLISPHGYGGLATGELWGACMHKRHAYRNRATTGKHIQHDEDCPCQTYGAFAAVTDPRYRYIGIARTRFAGGRWVVHLAE